MTVTVIITLIEDDPEHEIGFILEDLGQKLRRGHMNLTAYAAGDTYTIRDSSSIKVGHLSASEEKVCDDLPESDWTARRS